MATVKILIEGYAFKSSCVPTIALIQDKNLNIISDPGSLPSQKLLIDKLAQENLKIDDINVVFITHSHMDHYKNIGMFPHAKALDYWGWWQDDKFQKCSGRITENISIMKTPGHSYDNMTMLVETPDGTVAVCGDLIWYENAQKHDPYASDMKALIKNRKLVLEMADYIVPGHGKMFPSHRKPLIIKEK